MANLGSLGLFGACLLGVSAARAQASVLIAVSDPTQVAEVQVAKVVAGDSPLWLSVKLAGRARLAIVTSAASVEPASAADAWLRALDFSTRVRVMPPPGSGAACSNFSGQPADSGFPEPPSLSPTRVASLSSEVELRRSLSDAGLASGLAPVADFCAHVAAPFRFAVYESAESGGSSVALRLTDSDAALAVPGIATTGRESVPFTLLALAPAAVLPESGLVADPSDFPVSYLGASASTNYVVARAAWLNEDPMRWLLEARASTALFAWTEVSSVGEVEPAVSRYFEAAAGQSVGRACSAAAQTARAQSSHQSADFSCGSADDLSRSLTELDFGDVRLTRLFGSIGAAGVALRTSAESAPAAPVVATDLDANGCVSSAAAAPVPAGSNAPNTAGSPTGGSNVSAGTVAMGQGSTTVVDGNSSSVTVVADSCSGDSSSADSMDSCSGDSSSSSSSTDSCSGDSSSSSGSTDSCSGDSTSNDSNGSCNGDSSSSSSDDSSGCGKSNYDGDTCSGNSANSASAQGKSTAALEPGQGSQSSHGPRRVHLSLLTLLSALIALPLRRAKWGRLLQGL
jgi:hypothetical protein